MIGMSTLKSVPWRGVIEEFSNQYFYDLSWQEQGDDFLRSLAEQLVAAERPVHSTAVRFKSVRIWTADGTPAENVTLGIFDFDVAGAAPDVEAMDREACYLVRFRTTRPSITGRPVTLKKWLHSCALLGSSTSILGGNFPLEAATISALTTYGEAVRQLEGATGGPYDLVAPSGSGRRAGEVSVFEYIEHHEFQY